ncbi:MAG: isoprenylcysteine carboxylmethyltransferase family protein [Gammaproteobacteria bacterium]|nr:isoprenylcysteine carboxylmethyltransferase family protein [Gammaproteobacteria bacterium]MDH5653697.1 isoprenylcysteine carboxylmethyltransferase family protein [Gammaproteobacteria bacterium]
MSFVMIIFFIIFAVAGRSIWHYRLTGDYGLRSVHRNSPLIAIFSSTLIIIVFIGVTIVSFLSTFVGLDVYFQFGRYGNVIGVLFCLSGILLTSVSQLQMGKEWRIGVDENEITRLITHGIYSKVRNPIYSGVMIFGLGLLVLVPNLIMMCFTLLGYMAIEVHVRKVEEPYLSKLHGQSFTNYKNSTGRYIPKW